MTLTDTFKSVRRAAGTLADMTDDERNAVLADVADAIVAGKERLLAANGDDLARMDKANPLYDRLRLTAERLDAIAADMPDVQIFAMAPPLIDGYGVANGFEIYLQDRAGGSVDELYNVGRKFIDELQKRPEIGSAYTTFNVNFPQFLVEVDAAKC